MSKKQNEKASSKRTHRTAKAVMARARAASAGRTAGASASAAEREQDPRLPAVGTVIQKRDRHGNVRCKCRVEKQGIRYNGTVYRSLSGAAMAAAADLGLESPTQNGYTFWALS
jgi:hypothetical protein